jgi:hypothetical protein
MGIPASPAQRPNPPPSSAPARSAGVASAAQPSPRPSPRPSPHQPPHQPPTPPPFRPPPVLEREPASSSGMVAASSGVIEVFGRSNVELEATIASLQASKSDLEERLQRAEHELAELRSVPKARPEQAAFAAVAPAPLVVLPSDAQGAASVPLRFSSIPPALRTGRRKVMRWALTGGLLCVVVAFVAITVLSRAH